MPGISIYAGDIADCKSDVMVLKFAERLHGADRYISQLEDFNETVSNGEIKYIRSRHTSARHIVFIGVGELFEFNYEKVRLFSRKALIIANKIDETAETITITSHGPGYGLDERESFISLLYGIYDAFVEVLINSNIQNVIIVEKNKSRADRYVKLLSDFLDETNVFSRKDNSSARRASRSILSENVFRSAHPKARIFLAMPFAEKYDDEFSAIREACESLDVLCERVDFVSFVGDILVRIKKLIYDCDIFIALINDNNPNVFLEIGYAWGCNKRTVLILKDGEEIPFDIKNQKILIYKYSFKLRDAVKAEISNLLSEARSHG